MFASLIFLVYLRRLPTQWTRWKVLAAVACILTQFLFVTSTKLTTAANAIFLQYTAPIYVVLLGILVPARKALPNGLAFDVHHLPWDVSVLWR